MHKKNLFCIIFMLISIDVWDMSCMAPEQTVPTNDETSNPLNKSLFIFLDDGEYLMDMAGSASREFLSALASQASPIIVSASIIHNIRQWKNLDETNHETLYQWLQEWAKKPFSEMAKDFDKEKSIYCSTFFSQYPTIFDSWIIKKINSFLYLLIPKDYLNKIGVDEKNVRSIVSTKNVTPAEQKIGLKINHMPTIENYTQISGAGTIKTMLHSYKAYYFVDCIWSASKKTSNVFVTNSEYIALKNKQVPIWSIYAMGHGSFNTMAVGLSISDLKHFLTFLNVRINTKAFYYTTCYEAEKNNEIIYKDNENFIDRTYSFAIISHALTDAITYSVYAADVKLNNEHKLEISISPFFKLFAEQTAIDNPNYKNIATTIEAGKVQKEITLAAAYPQIRYPGLPWFSIIDDIPVVSIGSIFAKNRKKPLDISKFNKYRHKETIGILLYTQEIPFEIIVNTKGNPPEIVSMVPGDTVHYINKLTSSIHKTPALIKSFMKIVMSGPHKTFIIDTISGANEEIKNIVVQLADENNIAYWTNKNSIVYRRIVNAKEKIDKTTQASLLDRYSYSYLLKLKNLQSHKQSNNQESLTIFNSLKRDLGSLWIHSQASLSRIYIAHKFLVNTGLAFAAFIVYMQMTKDQLPSTYKPHRYLIND